MLAREIQSGARPPGSRLPSQAQLDAEGWSATTSAAAYRHLRQQGLVIASNRGAFVADPLPDGDPRPVEEQLADVRARLDELKQRVDVHDGGDTEVRALIADLQAALIDLYGRLGQPHPSLGAVEPTETRPRSASG
jgi:DNA-binding transcriptional MocR family regulator